MIEMELTTVDQGPQNVFQTASAVTRVFEDVVTLVNLLIIRTAAERHQIQFSEGVDITAAVLNQL
jgi:hypothetical protein